MNGRVTAANGRSEGRPSRQINVVLRGAEPPLISSAVPEREPALRQTLFPSTVYSRKYRKSWINW